MTFHDRLHLSTALLQLPPTLCALLQASHVALALLRAGDDLLLQLRSAQEESSRILFMVEMVPVSVVTVEGMEAMVMVVVNALVMVEAVVEAMVVSVVEELPKPCLWAEVVAVSLRARFVTALRFLKGLASHLQIHQRRGTVIVTLLI